MNGNQSVRRMNPGWSADRERERRRAAIQRKRIRQRRRRRARVFFRFAVFAASCMGILAMMQHFSESDSRIFSGLPGEMTTDRQSTEGGAGDFSGIQNGYPEILQELLEKNEETSDYVAGYGDREAYMGKPIDLTADVVSGEVPLLMQWDRRWGYDAYGEEMIGLAGCGPLCLDMAYLYFTGDLEMTPRKMAEFAYDNGFYTESGTSWGLWTEGCALLGMSGRELPLDEDRMKAELDAGGLIVCSMRPGDFTTTGHFILIRGYDEAGFYVNDPNRRSTSGKVWEYDTLQYQIRNLWGLRKEG